MDKITVSIIMATYNRAHFIIETLQSIQSQTFQNWECLIIDDGSTDNTFDVISPFLEQDDRFQYNKRPETYLKGLPGSRNYGLDVAKGNYIIFFDDDDIIHPQNLEICLDVLQKNKIDFCHYQKEAFVNEIPVFKNEDVKIISKISVNNIYDVVTQKKGIASCTVLWKKHCFATNRFNQNLQYAEEWECYLRIISEGYNGLEISNTLYFNRKHENSNTGEFYNNNPIRTKSKKEAIVLIIKNLVEKEMLSNSIFRYFVQLSLNYKQYNLLKEIFIISKFSKLEKLKWWFIYTILPLKLKLYTITKNK